MQPESSSTPLMMAATRRALSARHARETADPVAMARRAGVEPDAWQADLLRARAQQMILLCSRQSGKSLVSSLLALHALLYEPPAPILCLAPTLRQAKLLLRAIKTGFNALGRPARVVAESTTDLELSTGALVAALPGDEANVRGYSGVRLLILDEASRIQDPLYYACRPMMAVSGGRIILLSTPWGKRGVFHDVWTNGGPDWHRTRVTAEECPRIDPAWLEAERREVPSHVYQAEYLCEFTEPIDSVFAYADIQSALDCDAAPLFGGGA